MAEYADTMEADNAGEGEIEGTAKKLGYLELMQANNVAKLLTEQELGEISAKVLSEYDIDEQSREGWLKTNAEALKLAMMMAEEKNYPFKGSSNVKYPLVSSAALQFNARAYPAICPPDRPVKCKTYGKDPSGEKAARAERVSDHMSWQLTSQMPEWEEDTDRLTLVVSIAGCVFRKVYHDPSLRRNVTRLVTADRLVFNYWARSFNDLPRLTEVMSLYPNEIQERINDNRFMDFEYGGLVPGDATEDGEQKSDGNDSDGPHIFLEQHRLLDLDGDDYAEPYVVTIHKTSGKVCRIKANWTAETAVLEQDGQEGLKVISLRRQSYFVRYLFLPSPDGGAYGMGFGTLLASINDSIDTTLNQTFDAAHLATIQGGFISAILGPKVRDKTMRFEAGEWKIINVTGNMRDSMMPISYPGPSQVMMVLLEFLINSGKELASIKDVLTGDTPATAPVGTTAMLIDQGLMVFTSIYKRIHRGLREELKLLADLNERYLTQEEYAAFHDADGADPQADYNLGDMDILPVSDPQSVTKAQKIAKAQAVFAVSENNPAVDRREATRRVYEALDVEDIDKLMPDPPPPDPMLEDLMKRGAEAEVAEKEAAVEEKTASATGKLAAALKALADAEAAEAGSQMGLYGQMLAMLQAEHGMEMDIAGQNAVAGPGGIPGMEGQSDVAGGVPSPAGPGNGANPGAAGPVAGIGDVPAGAMGAGTTDGGLQPGTL